MDSEKKSKALARGINPFILLPSAFILYLPFPLIRLPKKRRKGRNQKAEGRRIVWTSGLEGYWKSINFNLLRRIWISPSSFCLLRTGGFH